MQRTEDSGVIDYTYNNLNQLVTGDWSGTLSTFGWTQTDNLDHVQIETGQQSKAATVFQQGEWTAKGFDLPAGDNTFTVTRTAQDQTTAQQQTTVTRPADQTQYQHDLNGNMLGLSGWSLTWNDENRLVAAETPTNVGGASRRRLTFVYDHQGRRRFKKVYTWDDPTQSWVLSETHTYLYDQWNVVCERVTDASTQTTTHSVYTWGLDLSNTIQGAGGVRGLLAAHSPDGDWFYAYDGNGNITTLVSTADGTIVASYDYSPFGLTISQSGPAVQSNAYRFSTKPLENPAAADGRSYGGALYYYSYRYYSPELGRWLNRDPIGTRDLEIKQRDLETDVYANVRESPVPWYDDELRLNKNSACSFFGDVDEANATLAHEVSHFCGTHDDPGGDEWTFAHAVEDLMDGDVSSWIYYRAARREAYRCYCEDE